MAVREAAQKDHHQQRRNRQQPRPRASAADQSPRRGSVGVWAIPRRCPSASWESRPRTSWPIRRSSRRWRSTTGSIA